MLEPKVKNFLSGKVTIILSKTRGKVETVDEKEEDIMYQIE